MIFNHLFCFKSRFKTNLDYRNFSYFFFFFLTLTSRRLLVCGAFELQRDMPRRDDPHEEPKRDSKHEASRVFTVQSGCRSLLSSIWSLST